jgi:hypothetical protein
VGCLRRRDPAGGRPRRTRATQRPSIFASPRRDTLHVQRHTAPFLGNCTLDRLPLFFAAALLKRSRKRRRLHRCLAPVLVVQARGSLPRRLVPIRRRGRARRPMRGAAGLVSALGVAAGLSACTGAPQSFAQSEVSPISYDSLSCSDRNQWHGCSTVGRHSVVIRRFSAATRSSSRSSGHLIDA